MIMKKFLLMALAATGMLATSCRDFDQFDDHAIKIQDYNRDFTKVFGNVDPNHTWNTASQRSMDFTINVPGTFNLRVFTTNPKNESAQSELLANFTNNGQGYKSGDTYSITFDCPSGLRKVWADIQYVGSERHIIQQVEMDMQGYAKAVFGGDGAQTRAQIIPQTGLITKTGKKEIFTLQAYTGVGESSNNGFISVIPENVENTHKEEVHTDFVYVSTGETYHLYPIYIFTGADVTVGVQYRRNSESDWQTEYAMLRTKPEYGENGRVMRLFSSSSGTDERTAITDSDPWSTAPSGFFQNINYNGTNTANATYYDWGKNYGSGAKYATLYDGVEGFVGTLCDEIQLNIPTGYEFRFWVQQGSFKRYSDRESNSDKLVYFGTFFNGHQHKDEKGVLKDVLYLGIEDWNNAKHDINDIVFAFVGSTPTIVDEGGPHYLDAEYVIAYEDMGANDFDFNDIVLGVQHVSGEYNMKVNVLACGGTLPVYLDYNNTDLFSGKELHEVLSGNSDSYHTPMNVSGDPLRVVNRSELQYQPKGETVSISTGPFSIMEQAKNFQLRVVQNPKNGIGRDKATISITTPDSSKGINDTPQAFVVSYTHWEWPTEGTKISNVYEDFGDWIKNHNSSGEWYNPIWSGLDGASSTVDYSSTLRPSYSFDICLRTSEQIATAGGTSITIPKSDFEAHGLTSGDSHSLVLAFVVTNRGAGGTATVTVKNGSTQLGTVIFSDESETSTISSYGDADKILLDNINWSSVENITVEFSTSVSGCKLNSIWAAKADKNIKMLDYEDVVGCEENCSVAEHQHTDACNSSCTDPTNHHSSYKIVGKLDAVGKSIDVAIANASTTRPNFLVCNAPAIRHQHSIASMIANAQAIATSASDDQKSARFTLTVTAMDGKTPIVSICNSTKRKYLKASGGSASWSDTAETNFKIVRGDGGSRTSCIDGWDDDDMFRFQAVGTSNYLNADGPKMAGGNGEWSLWYMFMINN